MKYVVDANRPTNKEYLTTQEIMDKNLWTHFEILGKLNDVESLNDKDKDLEDGNRELNDDNILSSRKMFGKEKISNSSETVVMLNDRNTGTKNETFVGTTAVKFHSYYKIY